MAIEAYIGRPGSGKTYTMTDKALKEMKKGRAVFANYNIVGATRFGPEDLLHLPPGLILLDEAHLYFSARAALRLPPSWLAMVSQTRKNGWDIWWTTQHERRVDSALKDVSNWFWLCSAWFGGVDTHPWFFRAKCYEPELFRKSKLSVGTTTRIFNQKVADSFDTYEQLEVATHATSKTDAYASIPSRFAGGTLL